MECGHGVYVYIKRYPSVEDFEAAWNIWIMDHDDNPLDVVIAQAKKLLPRFEIIEQGQVTKATTTELRTEKTETEPPPKVKLPTIEDIDSRFSELTESIQDRMLLSGPGRPGRDGRDGRDGKDGRDGEDGKDGRDLVATAAELGDLQDVFVSDAKRRQFLMFDGASWVASFVPRLMKGGTPMPERSEVGVIYLKNNTISTPISSVNGRSVVAGPMLAGELFNFAKDTDTNSLKYNGPGGVFHIIASFNFFSGSQDVCGFYIGRSADATVALDPNGDRISESEIYVNAAPSAAQPVGGMVQTIVRLNTNDRVFFIVQNKDSTHPITVQFLKFIVKE